MKIVLTTIGSRGDVQPYINLSQGLLAAGHDITLATNPTLGPLVEAHGVPFSPVGPPVDMGVEGARLLARSFNNMLLGMIRVMQLGASLVEAAYPQVLELCRDADLVISTDTGSGIAEAETLGKPWISVTLQPARIPVANPDQTRISKAVWSVLGKLFVAPTNSFRKRVGAPRVQDFNAMLSKRLLLLPVSPHVATPDPRWPAYVRQTGYWFPRPQENWQPLADLMDFISKGERPVVVSLGVMSQSGKPARQAALLTLSAILQSGRRAILQGWQETLKGEKIPDTVYLAGSMPHDWLFAQASAVVHHGGFGTTAAALRSGAPSILIPHVIDQFYWGQQVAALGVGPQPITRGKLTAPALTAALQQAAGDPEMQRRAADLGARIRADADGVQEAVRIIGEFNLS